MNESPLNWPRNYNSTPTIEGKRPGNLLPQKFTGWPAGRNRAANEAEELLSSAVAYWDASAYRDGDRFLRNLGVGGECLNLRLGSSTIPNSNDPQYLAPEDSGYVYLPGANSQNKLTVTSSSELKPSDLDIRFRISSDDWNLSGTVQFGGCYDGTASSSMWYTQLYATGYIALYISNGTAFSQTNWYIGSIFKNKQAYWIRFTYNSSTSTYTAYWKADQEGEPSSWTSLGSNAGTSGALNTITTQGISIGSAGSYTNQWPGKVYRFILKDSINGSTVLDIDCNDIESASQTNFSAKTGQIVQINRSTSGRKSVAMPSKKNGGQPMFIFGTDDYLECLGNQQHQLLNVRQGDVFTVVAVYRAHATITSSQTVITKSTSLSSSTTSPRWNVRYGGSNSTAFYLDDGVSPIGNAGVGITPSATSVFAATVSAYTLTGYYNGVLSGSVTRPSGSAANADTVRIGRLSGSGTAYSDMEFTAAAIFRRALSQQEIALLTNYFQNRKTFTYTIPSDNDQKEFMASRLGVSSSVAALDILKDAPFYIDSRNFTNGNQYVQNLGWRRDGLNVRLGSSGASDTNDPLYLTSASAGYVYLPGSSINLISVPYAANLETNGLSFSIVSRASINYATAEQSIFSRRPNGANAGFTLYATSDKLRLYYGTLSGSWNWVDSNTVTGLTDGSIKWYRVDVSSSTPPVVTFYYAPDSINEPSTWTQIGSPVTMNASTVLASSNSGVTIGNRSDTTSEPLTGSIYKSILRISGSTVLDIDCNSITSASASSFIALTGQTVSISRSTTGRKTVCMPSTTNGGRPIFLLGTDDYFEIEGDIQHDLLNFTSGDSFTVLAVVRQWATQARDRGIIAKRVYAGGAAGWFIAQNDATSNYVYAGDGTDRSNATPSLTLGKLQTTTLHVDRPMARLTAYLDGVAATSSTSIAGAGSYATQNPIRIGTLSGYSDMEFTAAAIFRRALSASEISTLTTFFTS